MAEQILQLVNGGAHEETKVGSNLLVAAASRVQFVASRADDHGLVFFHEVVDVFHSRIVEEFRRIFGVARDLVESVDNLGQLFGSEHTSMFERAGMRAAGGEFKRYQSLVIRKRLLPFFKLRVERLTEAAGPHLHCETSGKLRAQALFGSYQALFGSYQGIALAMPKVAQLRSPFRGWISASSHPKSSA